MTVYGIVLLGQKTFRQFICHKNIFMRDVHVYRVWGALGPTDSSDSECSSSRIVSALALPEEGSQTFSSY